MATTGDTLGIGISALLAYQRALTTTGHNVANVNTDGYSRQRVELVTRTPQQSGPGFIGTGVTVAGIERVYDAFLTQQVRTARTAHGELEQYHRLATQIDNLLADPGAGLTPSLQRFFDAVAGVANDPAAMAPRHVLLAEGRALADRLHYLDQNLRNQRHGVNVSLTEHVTELNGLAGAIARVNQEIVRAAGGAGGPPNDLLDQREALIEQLAEKVSVTTVAQDDGALNVFIGNGQTLVIGSNASTLSVVANPYEATRREIGYVAGGTTTIVSNNLNGGSLGAALRFRNEILDPAHNAIGRVATGLGLTFNAQHREGMDLNNALGADFFAVGAPAVRAASTNTGTGTVTAGISAADALTTSAYLVRFNGAGSWSVTRLSDNAVTSGAGPFALDGLTITVGGAAAIGDSFLVQPTRGGAETLAVALTDARGIAAAAPIRTRTASGNGGSGSISAGEVLDVTNPNLLASVTLNFVSGTQYQVNGAGPLLAYTSGANIDRNGWRVQISGAPAAGDVYTIEANTGGVSDNRNALQLADLANQRTLANASATYLGAYSHVVTDVGALTRSAEIGLTAQTTLLRQVTAARDAVSAVNLDEEAANMLRFQQAYQAAAQIIATADTLFQSLLAAVRR